MSLDEDCDEHDGHGQRGQTVMTMSKVSIPLNPSFEPAHHQPQRLSSQPELDGDFGEAVHGFPIDVPERIRHSRPPR